MSRVADFDRSTEGMRALFGRVCALCDGFFDRAVIADGSGIASLFQLYDMMLTQRAILSAMICSAEEIGTHGSALVDQLPDRSNGAPRTTRTLTRGKVSRLEPVSVMPTPELWFETLLARKRQEMNHEKE